MMALDYKAAQARAGDEKLGFLIAIQ
jgi:hypothetical protein